LCRARQFAVVPAPGLNNTSEEHASPVVSRVIHSALTEGFRVGICPIMPATQHSRWSIEEPWDQRHRQGAPRNPGHLNRRKHDVGDITHCEIFDLRTMFTQDVGTSRIATCRSNFENSHNTSSGHRFSNSLNRVSPFGAAETGNDEPGYGSCSSVRSVVTVDQDPLRSGLGPQ